MAAVASFFKDLGLAFIPLFVAMDAIGSLPFLLALTQEMGPRERTKVVRYAMLTALLLGLGFVAIGKGVFSVLGIEVADFLVAGGLILLILSVKELVAGKMLESQPSLGEEMVGVVPIGMPLVAGPAVLTTLLILSDQYSVQVVHSQPGSHLASLRPGKPHRPSVAARGTASGIENSGPSPGRNRRHDDPQGCDSHLRAVDIGYQEWWPKAEGTHECTETEPQATRLPALEQTRRRQTGSTSLPRNRHSCRKGSSCVCSASCL